MSEQQSAQHERPVDTAVASADATLTATASSAAPTVGRVFVYNGQEYPDPDPALAVDYVRRELARFVPELTNADVREERRADGTTQYVFTKRLGTKGAVPDAAGAVAERPGTREAEPDAPANTRLIALVGAISPTRLEIFRLAHELVLPNGEFDLDAAAARGEELERASAAAHAHAAATGELRDLLLKLPAA